MTTYEQGGASSAELAGYIAGETVRERRPTAEVVATAMMLFWVRTGIGFVATLTRLGRMAIASDQRDIARAARLNAKAPVGTSAEIDRIQKSAKTSTEWARKETQVHIVCAVGATAAAIVAGFYLWDRYGLITIPIGLAVTVISSWSAGSLPPQEVKEHVAMAKPTRGAITVDGMHSALRAASPKIDKIFREALRDAAGDPGSYICPIPPFDVIKDTDGSWSAEIELPNGVTVQQIEDKKAEFAGTFRDKQLSQVWLSRGTGESTLRVQILPQPMHKMPKRGWLQQGKMINPEEGLHIAWNPRGKAIRIEMMNGMHLLSGMTDTGKSGTLAIMQLGMLAIPNSMVILANGKGGRALNPYRELAFATINGNDEEQCERFLYAVQWLVEQYELRREVMGNLPDEMVPDDKLTLEVIKKIRYGPDNLPFAPAWLIADEFEEYGEYGHWGEVEKCLVKIARKARFVGVGWTLCTQTSGKLELDPRARNNAFTRMAHYLDNSDDTQKALGDNWTGTKPQHLGRVEGDGEDSKKTVQGIVVVRGAKAGGDIGRVPYLDIPARRKAAEQIHAKRRTNNMLFGEAIGLDPLGQFGSKDKGQTGQTVVDPTLQLLLDILEVAGDEEHIGTKSLLLVLAGRWPERYREWSAVKLGREISAEPYCVQKDSHEGRRGVYLDKIREAIGDGEYAKEPFSRGVEEEEDQRELRIVR